MVGAVERGRGWGEQRKAGRKGKKRGSKKKKNMEEQRENTDRIKRASSLMDGRERGKGPPAL